MIRMSLGDFAALVERTAMRAPRAERLALRIAGARLAAASRGYIGEYQMGIGGFPDWAPLAARTREEKIRKGYSPPDNPLLRTGQLRASIRFTVQGRSAIIGTDDPVGRYQEFGTARIPPRPFVGLAVAQYGQREARQVFASVLSPLLKGR